MAPGLAILDAYFLGSSATEVGGVLWQLYLDLESATTEQELNAAAASLSKVLAGPIADGLLKVLMVGAGKGSGKVAGEFNKRYQFQLPNGIKNGSRLNSGVPGLKIVDRTKLQKSIAQSTKSGTLTFNHTVKTGKTTDAAALRSEIQLHVDAWNEILQKKGMAGLKRRLQQWEQFGDDIEAAGRKYTKGLGSVGEGKVWPHYPDMATGGRPKSAVGSPADRRLNSIIGGQADRLRREILDMPDDVTRFDFNLDVR
jgi:hypothetical protein